ncbi:MAG TPA: ABC transporter permease [Hanamia sp.]|jgi:putative ABC transport system permease protein|nr:ABC transporter permease [Hanamia sp.]
MIKNYFKIAFRNLWKNKVFSFINILGLTVGMTACFLIFLYVKFELSYDAFNTKANRIYRLVTDLKTPSDNLHISVTSWSFAPKIKSELPEVQSFTRVSDGSFLITKGDKKFQEDKMLFADSSLFHVFDFKLLKGNPNTALKDPYSIVLSQTYAKKYFGNENPLGQILLFSGDHIPATVTGVMKDIPDNSQIKTDFFVSMSTLTKKINPGIDDQWGNFGATSYLLLKPETNAIALEKKLPALLKNWIGTDMDKAQMHYTLSFEPLRDVYLYSDRDGSKTGNIRNVYIFSIIAIFILLIACFNFINLTTARASERAKEVGIRKVVGASKRQLGGQFIGESILLCLMAFILVVGLSALLLPSFNHLSGKIISHGIFSNLSYLLILFFASIAIGFIAGIYPALVLSSFKPIVVLKGRFSTGTKGILLRKGLVVAQFTISITLIICTIIVYSQMKYMRGQDLGFNKDQMIIVDTNGDSARFALKQSLLNIPNVKSVSLSSSAPGMGNSSAYSQIENKQGDMQVGTLALYNVDYDFIPQYKIKMVAGRAFSKDFASDTTQALILNEAAVKQFGYNSPDQIIGKKFDQWGRQGKVIGVMKDFHYRSLQENIMPLSMRINPHDDGLVNINVASANIPKTLAAIEHKWKEMIPARPFSYNFLDDTFNKQYLDEDRFEKLFFNFSILAIFISCLGLLGLASYSTIQRTKEIGIRKVLGASVSGITSLLSKDFIKLVLIALIMASPVAWFGMHKWLQGFAYRINIGLWVFILAGVLAILIALLTVSFQAIKAAVANPVKSLRSE